MLSQPTGAMVSAAITSAVRRFGVGGCAARMAQEFGDHPEAVAGRMRWLQRVSGTGLKDQHQLRRAWVLAASWQSYRGGCQYGRGLA